MNASQRGADLEKRTVKVLTDMGWKAERIGRPRSGRPNADGQMRQRGSQDVFNVGDILACEPGVGFHLIQVTTKSQASAKRKKIREQALGAPVRLFLWDKPGRVWTFTSEEIA